MANTYTASSGVRLFDVRSSGVLLYPETSLPMVQMETFGGVVSSGMSLGLDAQSAWDSGLDDIVSGSYCPLSKVIDGNTQYADMYTAGGTATVTDIGTSTGYGTLLNTVEVTTTVRGYDSATDDLIPTEKAVAAGLATKQEVLSAGSGIVLTPDGYGTTVLSVKGAVAVADLTNASQELYPTEYAVRLAINAAADNAQNNAVNIVTSQIAAAGYANSTWCLNTFYQKGETPSGGGGDVPYATYDTAGKVMPLESHGLVLGGQGSMNLMVAPIYSTHALASAAAAYYIGGVKVLNAMAGVSNAYQLSAYVPNTYAVHAYCYTNYVSKTDYAVKSSGTVVGKAGIIEPGVGLIMSDTSKLALIPASASVLGGVMVPSQKGLSLNAYGSLTLSAAPLVPDYTYAVSSSTNNNLGGVCIMSTVVSAAAGQSSTEVVPTVDAVYRHCADSYVRKTDSATADSTGIVQVPANSGLCVDSGELRIDSTLLNAFQVIHESASDNDSQARITVGNWVVVDSAGEIAFFRPSYQSTFISRGAVQTRYATVTRKDNVTVSGGVARSSGFYGWSSGTTIMYTYGSAPVAKDPIYSGYSGNSSGHIIGHVLTAPSGGSMTVALWNVSINNASSATISGSRFSVPIAEVRVAPDGAVTVTQLQKGPIVSEAIPGGAAEVSCAAPISKITEATSSGAVGLNYDPTYLQVVSGALTLVPGAVGGAYKGPFAVSATESDGTTLTAVFSGGLVRTLQGDIQMPDRGGVVSEGETVYFYGSSGMTVDGTPHQITTNYIVLSDGASAVGAAGEHYTRLATNVGGTMQQLQYGDIICEHWGDDYRDVYAISRVPLPDDVASGNTGYHRNRYILASGGSIYGCNPFNSALSSYISSYPLDGNLTSSQTFMYPTVSNYTSSGSHPHDGLYLTTGVGAQVWLNVWSGTWPASAGGWNSTSTKMWRYIVDTQCYERFTSSWCSGAYSVQIGDITNNGAPVQMHRGAVAVRGRWN